MASIYKRPGSKTWQAAFYVIDPETGVSKQVRQSTHKSNEREAKAAAAELERRAREAAGGGHEKARRILDVLQRAGQEANKETLNVPRARQFLAEIVRISTGEDMPAFTIKTWLEEWKRRKCDVTAPATQARYASSVKAFLAWLGDRADKPLESLTVADVRNFREKLTSEGRTARTAQHYVRDIGSGLRTAVREGLLTHNPASGLDPLEFTDSVDRKPFVAAEVVKLINAAPSADWKGMILLGLYTGLRLGDIAKLKWGMVDFTEGTLRLMPAKTKKKKRMICIPLHPQARQFLENHPIADDPDEPIFPTLAIRRIDGNKGLSMTFVDIMTKAGVSRGKARIVEKESAGRSTHERGFHALRHAFVTMLTNCDVDEDLRKKLAGHTDSEVHAIYTHFEVKTLAAAIEKMPGLGALQS
ncbi:tyrosine-type recombinase/integrase [bacterium]|nr:tyrosine-type recombinase/integrase [bacterium]